MGIRLIGSGVLCVWVLAGRGRLRRAHGGPMHCGCEAGQCPHAGRARQEAWDEVYAAVRSALGVPHLPANDRLVLQRMYRAAATLSGHPVLQAAPSVAESPPDARTQ